jgi:hypothetical protein
LGTRWKRPSADVIYKSLDNIVWCNLAHRQNRTEETEVPRVLNLLETSDRMVGTLCTNHIDHQDALKKAFRMYTSKRIPFEQAKLLSALVCDGNCLQYAAAALCITLSLESRQSLDVYSLLYKWSKLDKELFQLYVGRTLVRSSNLSWLVFPTNDEKRSMSLLG